MPEPERQERRSGSFLAFGLSAALHAQAPGRAFRLKGDASRPSGRLNSHVHLPCDKRTGRRAGAPFRVARSVQRLTAAVAGLELVPVADPRLAQLPAEVGLTPIEDRGEIDQAAIDVADHDAELLQLGE